MNSQEGVCNPVHPSGPRSKGHWESSGRVAGGLRGVSRCSALILGRSPTLTPATAIWAIVGTTGRGLSGQVSCAALSPLRNWEIHRLSLEWGWAVPEGHAEMGPGSRKGYR